MGVWLAFGSGCFVGVFIGILMMGLFIMFQRGENLERLYQERRSHSRKAIGMTAQFRVSGYQGQKEHDIYIKDISQEGVYAIFPDVAGIENILKSKGISVKAQIIINIPGLEDPLVLNCEVVRMSINQNIAGLGLEYRKLRAQEQSVINETLLAS